MHDEPRFSEDELKRLFERAAARQESARRAAERSGEGLTLSEAQQVAAAAGIDPRYLAEAAAEVHAGRGGEPETLLGMPVVLERARVVPGALTEQAWAAMVREVRAEFGEDGAVGQLGDVREWTAVGRGLKRDVATRLVAEPVEGGTRLVLRQSIREMARGFGIALVIQLVVMLLVVGGALLFPDPQAWVAIALLGGLVGAMGGGLAVGTRVWEGRQRRGFERTLDRLELVAQRQGALKAAAPQPAAPLAPPEAASGTADPLGLDALDAPAADAARADRARDRA